MPDHGDCRFLITRIKSSEFLIPSYTLHYMESTVKIWVNSGSSIRLKRRSDVGTHDAHFHHHASGFEPLGASHLVFVVWLHPPRYHWGHWYTRCLVGCLCRRYLPLLQNGLLGLALLKLCACHFESIITLWEMLYSSMQITKMISKFVRMTFLIKISMGPSWDFWDCGVPWPIRG